ncbi:MAG: hypothetical protein ABSB25_07015 [Sedimentisphaerales bacterium]
MAGREPEVMDLAIPNGIVLAQAMVSGLTGNAVFYPAPPGCAF